MKGHGIAGMRTHIFQPEHRAQTAGFPHATHLQMGWVSFFLLHISVRMRLTKEGVRGDNMCSLIEGHVLGEHLLNKHFNKG